MLKTLFGSAFECGRTRSTLPNPERMLSSAKRATQRMLYKEMDNVRNSVHSFKRYNNKDYMMMMSCPAKYIKILQMYYIFPEKCITRLATILKVYAYIQYTYSKVYDFSDWDRGQ